MRGLATGVLTPGRLIVVGRLRAALGLRSTTRQPQRLAVDDAVHPAKAGRHSTAQVSKGWVTALAPGDTRPLEKPHPVKPIPTRRRPAGKPAVDARIDAAVQAQAALQLKSGNDRPARETRMPQPNQTGGLRYTRTFKDRCSAASANAAGLASRCSNRNSGACAAMCACKKSGPSSGAFKHSRARPPGASRSGRRRISRG